MSYNFFRLTTQPYPLEVFEAAKVDPLSFSVEIWSVEQEFAAVAPPAFSGSHVQTLFPAVYDASDYANVAPPSFAGTHVQTLFPRAYSERADAVVATPTFSGTNVQTLFPLAHTAEIQNARVAALTFTGTLV